MPQFEGKSPPSIGSTKVDWKGMLVGDTISIDTFCQEKISPNEIFSTPCALSPDVRRAAVILDRSMKRMEGNKSFDNQSQLRDILKLIGTENYAKRLPSGFDAPKERLWLAAFGITEGDRSSGANAKSPGKPSGLLQIDVDHYSEDEQELRKVQHKLMELPYIVATFISPSRNGVKAIAAIDKAEDFDKARGLGVACTKAVCDHLDIVGYREGVTKNSASNFERLPQYIRERFGQAHVDFSVANDPRKGCFIPAKDSFLLTKEKEKDAEIVRFCNFDDNTALTGWYFHGCTSPFTSGEDSTDSPFALDESSLYEPQMKQPTNRPDIYEQRWQNYVKQAIINEFSDFENAGEGAHHQAAISLGRTIKRFSPYLNDLNELFYRADYIIDHWSPRADSPSTEKKTVRDMQAYAEVISRDDWIRKQKQQDGPRAPNRTQQSVQSFQKQEPAGMDGPFVDFDEELQPDFSKQWDRERVSQLFVRTFLAKYRKTPDGGAVNLKTCTVISRSILNDLKERIWYYTDTKNNQKDLTLQKALAICGERLGQTVITPVMQPDMKKGEIKFMSPGPGNSQKTLCINCAEGSPLLGVDLEKTATELAKKEAAILADFCEGRFLDKESYPKLDEAKQVAKKEAAYYFKYLTQALMYPTQKLQCAVAMLSRARGTGKSTMTLDLPTILGGECTQKIDQKSVANANSLRFAWADLEGKIFGVFDDFQDPPDTIAASLREMISSPTMSVERKGIQQKNAYNYARLFVSTNKKEFLAELNSGTETERRWHLFSIKTKIGGDPACDAGMQVVKKYKNIVFNAGKTAKEEAELQAFRCATVLEFMKRVKEYEETYEVINLNQAIDSAEFRTQRELGLGHNKIARTAGNILLSSENGRMGKRELYTKVKELRRDTTLTERYIAEKMAESGWFVNKIKDGKREIALSESGLQSLTAPENILDIITKISKWPVRERMEKINQLRNAGEINTVQKEGSQIDIICLRTQEVISGFSLVDNAPSQNVMKFDSEEGFV